MSDKSFKTYKQQIHILRQKSLTVSNEQFAVAILEHVSYFALINGYKGIFKDKTTNNYIKGVEFEDIVYLYKFDESLRNLLLKYILVIERRVKSLISYAFCKSAKSENYAYLNEDNYNYAENENEVKELIKILNDILKDEKYVYITHYKKEHKNVPLWVLFNAVSFGKMSKMYNYCRIGTQQSVANAIGTVSNKDLINMLSVLTKFRNVCAHNERLYNYCTQDTLTELPIHKNLKIPKENNQYIYGMRDLFAVIIIFKYLLRDKDFLTFYNELYIIINSFNFKTSIIRKQQVLDDMGFPSNWQDIKDIPKKIL